MHDYGKFDFSTYTWTINTASEISEKRKRHVLKKM
jgi:hypothetical protein